MKYDEYDAMSHCPWCSKSGTAARKTRPLRWSDSTLRCNNPWHYPNREEEEEVNSKERMIAQAEAAKMVADQRLVKVLAMPDEPNLEECNVIYFEKMFRNGTTSYVYAAVLAGDGLWYTTGPQAPKGYTWGALLEFIGLDSEIWLAESWVRITP